jgi:hypothetical protein
VVGLPDHADASVRQLVGDPQLPQRAAAVELLRHHLVRQPAEVTAATAAHVVIDVEVLVVDPHRVVDGERWLGEPLTVARSAAHAASHVVAQLFEAGRLPPVGLPERSRPADVHVRRGALDLEKRRVERCEPGGGHR